MEIIRTCEKLLAGEITYVVDYENRYFRLGEDTPESGDTGSWHDDETNVFFDDINAILDSKSSFKTIDFAQLFGELSSNNGPLLVAVLLNEGLLTKGAKRQFYPTSKRL